MDITVGPHLHAMYMYIVIIVIHVVCMNYIVCATLYVTSKLCMVYVRQELLLLVPYYN